MGASGYKEEQHIGKKNTASLLKIAALLKSSVRIGAAQEQEEARFYSTCSPATERRARNPEKRPEHDLNRQRQQ